MKKIIKNIFNLSVNQLLNILFTLIITPILFIKIEVESFGIVNFYFTLVMIFSVFIGYGFNINGPKRIASFKSNIEIQKLTNDIISTRLYLGFLFLFFSLISFFFKFHISNYNVFIFSLIILMSEALNPFFYFQGTDKLIGLVFSNFFTKCFYLIFIIFFINSKSDAYLVNFFFGLSCLFVHLICWIYIYYNFKLTLSFSKPKQFIKRINENFYFTLSSLSGYLSINSALFILYFFVSNAELGKFSLAQKVGLLLRMIPVFITQSILQEAARKYISNKYNFNNFLNKTYKISLLSTFSLALLITLLSKWIIYFLSGEFIQYSQTILSILAFIPFFSMLNFKNMVNIIVNERKKILNKTSWYTVCFTFISGLVMSFYYGGMGMSISLVISELINYKLCNHYLNKDE